FVCEDNGIGISVKTPDGWIAESLRARPGIRYFVADGLDLVDAHDMAAEAARYARRTRRPALLHLRVTRLLGHAGSDVETSYRPLAEVEAEEARDPLLRSARTALESGLLSAEELLA